MRLIVCPRTPHLPRTEAMVVGGIDIYVKFRHGVDPYFHLSMLEYTDGWWKVWLF
jgi:hypothetical protein